MAVERQWNPVVYRMNILLILPVFEFAVQDPRWQHQFGSSRRRQKELAVRTALGYHVPRCDIQLGETSIIRFR